ncbi:MAG: acyl-CoA synthetase, partial [Roseibium sp.]|nr:acyl-CoA synthetase [Roseibium sp.]
RDGSQETEDSLIAFCKEQMAGFKRPKKIVFTELPKTATGKIQKYVLRQEARKIALKTK